MARPHVIVALDLGKYKHVALVYDTHQRLVCERLLFPVNQQGFAALSQCLQRHGTPETILIGCEATGHYGETVLHYLQTHQYAVVRLNPAQVVQFRRGLGRRAKTDVLMLMQLPDSCRSVQPGSSPRCNRRVKRSSI